MDSSRKTRVMQRLCWRSNWVKVETRMYSSYETRDYAGIEGCGTYSVPPLNNALFETLLIK